MAISVASDNDIVDPVVTSTAPIQLSPPDEGTVKSATRTPPPNYLVLRVGSTQPERFQAADDGEALTRLQREVRAGQSPVIYCYKLWVHEEFVSTSKTTTYL